MVLNPALSSRKNLASLKCHRCRMSGWRVFGAVAESLNASRTTLRTVLWMRGRSAQSAQGLCCSLSRVYLVKPETRIMKSRSIRGLGPVAVQVLAYLSRHQNAPDTTEGIAEWWLLEQRMRNATIGVKAALAELVAAGLLLEKTGREGRAHFRINPRRRRSVEAALGEADGNSRRSSKRRGAQGLKGS